MVFHGISSTEGIKRFLEGFEFTTPLRLLQCLFKTLCIVIVSADILIIRRLQRLHLIV